MDFRTMYDLDFRDKRVLVRVDFNVPLNEHGDVLNDKRIREALPTIRYLRAQGARIVLLTHVGRPKGKRVTRLATDGIAHRLSQLLHVYVPKLDCCVGPQVSAHIAHMRAGDVVMLENVRFFPQEKENNNDFARQLARHVDFFIQDAFGVCHRKQASLTQVAQFIPACAGFLLQKELDALATLLVTSDDPFVTIIGGAKADKIGVITNLLPSMHHLLIGGKLANTFLKAAGKDIGASKYDEETLPLATRILYEAHGKLLLPEDVVVADHFGDGAQTKIVSVDAIPADWMAVDIGPATREKYAAVLNNAATIVWCGPIGVFEIEPFSHGTKHIAHVVAQSNATTIIGGGDSATAVQQFAVAHYMDHVSTGGGASLEILQGAQLPGIHALIENKRIFSELFVYQ